MKDDVQKKVSRLFIHPVKGLTPKEVSHATVRKGRGIPGDRAYALLFKDVLDVSPQSWQPKKHLAVQNDFPSLAALNCTFSDDLREMTVVQGSQVLLEASLANDEGRESISQFFSKYLSTQVPSPSAKHPEATAVQLVGELSDTLRFPDRNASDISFLNLASLRALERELGAPIDIRNFRGNVILDGLDAWEELNWIGKTVRVGTARVSLTAHIARCYNVNVDALSGTADERVLALVAKTNRGRFGVLGNVIEEGTLKVGDALTVE